MERRDEEDLLTEKVVALWRADPAELSGHLQEREVESEVGTDPTSPVSVGEALRVRNWMDAISLRQG